VCAISTVYPTNGQSILVVIHEAIHNHSLLSEFQLRNYGIIIESICHRHGGTQKMIIADSNHFSSIIGNKEIHLGIHLHSLIK
jgi:hypothetical protein